MTCPEGYPNDRRAELFERLAQILPGDLQRVFLCNSGTEAVEAALKFARLATGRTEVVAMMRGFHGRTMGSLSATWEKKFRAPFAPLVPGFHHAAYENLEAVEQALGASTACVLVEAVQGEGGVRVGSGDYLLGLRRLCDDYGALLIVDEVQTGFGRTGRTFASDHHDLVPDVMCLGKALGGGMPMGAVAVGARVPELPPGSHGSTFGGNPLACAAAVAGLDVLEGEELAARSAAEGAWLLERLRGLRTPMIREVRGLGLMIGIELRTRVAPILRELLRRRVLALPGGPTVLRLLPPLTISRADLELVVAAIEDSLQELAAHSSGGES